MVHRVTLDNILQVLRFSSPLTASQNTVQNTQKFTKANQRKYSRLEKTNWTIPGLATSYLSAKFGRCKAWQCEPIRDVRDKDVLLSNLYWLQASESAMSNTGAGCCVGADGWWWWWWYVCRSPTFLDASFAANIDSAVWLIEKEGGMGKAYPAFDFSKKNTLSGIKASKLGQARFWASPSLLSKGGGAKMQN